MANIPGVPSLNVDNFGHTFVQDIIDRQPVMQCTVCDLVWWPDQRTPRQSCKQKLASDARRRR